MAFVLNGDSWLLCGIHHSRVTLKAGYLAGITASGVGFFSSGLLAGQSNFFFLWEPQAPQLAFLMATSLGGQWPALLPACSPACLDSGLWLPTPHHGSRLQLPAGCNALVGAWNVILED